MGQEGLVWFLGKIEDVNDPLKLGSVRARVFGEGTDNLPKEALKWATPLLPIVSASLAGVGISPTGIMVGTHVMGIYLDGQEKQKLLVLGTLAKIPGMDDARHDVNQLARGNQTLEKQQIGPEPSSAYHAEYPYNQVISTQAGHVIEIDSTPGEERLHIYHKTGSYEEINKDGRRVTKTTGDNYQITAGDEKIYIQGNAKIEIQGNCEITVAGDSAITAAKANITASGDVTVQGSKIKLN